MNNPPIIVAHRGIHHSHPENSLAAFRAAADERFWIECDVHASRDGEVVIFHDETLERMTGSDRPIASLDARELLRIQLRGSDQAIPTLSTALQLCPESGWLVEIKPSDARDLVHQVVNLLARHATWWMIQSFDRANLLHLRAYHPQAPMALLVDRAEQIGEALADSWPAVHVQHELLTLEVRDALRERGVSVGAWTVNEPADLDRVLILDVDVIISDEPQRVRARVGDPCYD